jgi:hypothetical protein
MLLIMHKCRWGIADNFMADSNVEGQNPDYICVCSDICTIKVCFCKHDPDAYDKIKMPSIMYKCQWTGMTDNNVEWYTACLYSDICTVKFVFVNMTVWLWNGLNKFSTQLDWCLREN